MKLYLLISKRSEYYIMIDLDNKKTKAEDEIDLRVVFSLLLSYIKKHKILIYVLSTLGLLAGGFVWYTSKPIYQTSMVAKTDYSYLLNSEVLSIMGSIQKLRTKVEFTQLADRLGISEEKVKQLKKIDANPISTESTPNYTQTSFVINVEVTDNNILDSLQWSIIHVLETTDYVKNRKESKLIKLQTLQNKISQELNDLDSVKYLLNSTIKNGRSSNIFSDPGNINARIVDLYEKKLATEEAIRFIKPVQLIEGFKKYRRPDSPGILIHTGTGFIIGFILAFAIIIFKLIKNKIQSYI